MTLARIYLSDNKLLSYLFIYINCTIILNDVQFLTLKDHIFNEQLNQRQQWQVVPDGGALLHRVHWIKGTRFKKVILAYVTYVRKNYGNCFIVFDGYESATSVKSNEHAMRMAMNGSSRDITIREDNEVPYSKERFLANTHFCASSLCAIAASFVNKRVEVKKIEFLS